MSARHGGGPLQDEVGAARERVRRSTSQTLSDDSESEMSHLRSASRARVKERPSSDTTEVCLHFLHLPVPINIGPLSPNIVGCIIIQNCQLSQSDSRRRGGLVINSSNFASQDPGFLGLELRANQCWAIIIQHCCYVIDSRRRGVLVINSSNFTSLGHNFSSYHGIVSFFPFPLYFLCQINFGGYPGMDKYSIRWGIILLSS